MRRPDADLFTDDDLPGWYRDAACQDTPTDVFFPESGRTADAALEVCGRCEVRGECLAYALDAGLPGVWGGTTEHARKRLRRHAA